MKTLTVTVTTRLEVPNSVTRDKDCAVVGGVRYMPVVSWMREFEVVDREGGEGFEEAETPKELRGLLSEDAILRLAVVKKRATRNRSA